MGTVKRWNGSEFSDTNEYYMWDGSTWVRPTFHRFSEQGTWEEVATVKKVTETWNATWSQSYDQGNYQKAWGSDLGRLYQGRYDEYDPGNNIWHNPVYFGIQRSLIGFDFKSIQEELGNSKIHSIELFLHSQHAWYGSGATASISAHKFTAKPAKYDNVASGIANAKFNTRSQGIWIPLDISWGNKLATGEVTGFGLYKNSRDLNYYGYWYGSNGDAKTKPKIRITYDKYITGAPPVDATKPKLPAQYTKVQVGEGLVQVTERLMRAGLVSSNFSEARLLLMRLNNFSTSNPILQPNQLIMYKAAS